MIDEYVFLYTVAKSIEREESERKKERKRSEGGKQSEVRLKESEKESNNRTREKQGNKQLLILIVLFSYYYSQTDSLSEEPLIVDKSCSRPRHRPCNLRSSLCININHPPTPAAARAIATATPRQRQHGNDPPRALNVNRHNGLLMSSGLIWQVPNFLPQPRSPALKQYEIGYSPRAMDDNTYRLISFTRYGYCR